MHRQKEAQGLYTYLGVRDSHGILVRQRAQQPRGGRKVGPDSRVNANASLPKVAVVVQCVGVNKTKER